MGRLFRGPTGNQQERHFFYYFDDKNTSYLHSIIYTESISHDMKIGESLDEDKNDLNIKGWINFPMINFKYEDSTGNFYLNGKVVLTLTLESY